MRRIFAALAAALAMLATAAPAVADTTGSLIGTVTASGSGRPLAGVAVTISSPSHVDRTVTDAKGFYSFACVPDGVYTVTFVLHGFLTTYEPGVSVAAGIQSVAKVSMYDARVMVRIIDYTPNGFVRPGKVADFYVLTPYTDPFYSTAPFATSLRMVPGVQIVGGFVAPY